MRLALPLIQNLAGRIFIARLVGHEENVGQELVPTAEYRRLYRQVIGSFHATPAEDLANQRDIYFVLVDCPTRHRP